MAPPQISTTMASVAQPNSVEPQKVKGSMASINATKQLEIKRGGFQKKERRCVLHPEESSFARHWDMVTAVCLVFVCFISPYEVAFHTQQETTVGALFVMNRLVDAVFICDMGIQFFVMYPVTTHHSTVYIAEHVLIMRHYLRTWFMVDLVSVFPFDILGLLLESDELSQLKLIRAIRLVRLLKLARLLRAMRIVKRWEVEVGMSYRKMSLMQLFGAVIVACHWFGCCLGIINSLQGEACFAPDEPVGCAVTWISETATKRAAGGGGELVPWQSYVIALYTATTIIVHPHFTDPTSDGERICFIILIFVGGFLWTRVISQSTAVSSSMNRHIIQYHQTMDDLNMYMGQIRMPQDMKRHLRCFFMNRRNASEKSAWNQILVDMSPVLRTEVCFFMYKKWLQRVSYLRGTSKLFTSRLTLAMDKQTYAKEETFGDDFKLYILVMGMASRGEGKICIMGTGSTWGEEHLLLSAWFLLRPNTAFAMTYIEVLSLDRSSFEAVVEEFPEMQLHMRRFFVWYLVIRGIIHRGKAVKEKREEDGKGQRPESPAKCNSYGDVIVSSPAHALAVRPQRPEEDSDAYASYRENLRQRRNSALNTCKVLSGTSYKRFGSSVAESTFAESGEVPDDVGNSTASAEPCPEVSGGILETIASQQSEILSVLSRVLARQDSCDQSLAQLHRRVESMENTWNQCLGSKACLPEVPQTLSNAASGLLQPGPRGAVKGSAMTSALLPQLQPSARLNAPASSHGALSCCGGSDKSQRKQVPHSGLQF